jgi:hypothetical protein
MRSTGDGSEPEGMYILSPMFGADPDKLGAIAIWVLCLALCVAMIALTWGQLIE